MLVRRVNPNQPEQASSVRPRPRRPGQERDDLGEPFNCDDTTRVGMMARYSAIGRASRRSHVAVEVADGGCTSCEQKLLMLSGEKPGPAGTSAAFKGRAASARVRGLLTMNGSDS